MANIAARVDRHGDPSGVPPATQNRESGWLVGLSLVAIALTPYLTVGLPFGLGMRAQASLIMMILLGLCATGRERLRPWLEALPRAARWAFALWVASAIWGALVGWFASNPPRHVIGQLAAMLLLPLAAVAFGAQRGLTGRRVASALVVAAVGGVVIHLVAISLHATPAQHHGELLRLLLANDIGLSGAAPAALLFIAAAWWAGAMKRGWVGFAASLILVAGSMSRGAWLVSVAGLVALAAVVGRGMLRSRARHVFLVAGAATVLLVVLLTRMTAGALMWRLGAGDPGGGSPTGSARVTTLVEGRHAVAVPATDAGRERPLVDGLRAEAPAVELTCLALGPRGTGARLSILGRDGRGEEIVRADVGLGGGGVWTRTDRVVLLPRNVKSISVTLWTSGGGWHLAEVAVRAVNGALSAWLRTARWRLVSLAQAVGDPTSDVNVLYRIEETAAVLNRWREASLAKALLGHGLGATYAFSNPTYEERGERVYVPAASYIHNFYLFLAFKLGIAGLAALGGLAILVAVNAAAALHPRSPDQAWAALAATVILGAYLVWGVTSPELIDFRVVPLLGALVAVGQVGGEQR